MSGLEPLKQPEMIVGLIGPVGTDLRIVVQCIAAEFTAIGYRSEEIRLSTLLHNFGEYRHLSQPSLDEARRIDIHMDAADDLRDKTSCADIMSLLSVIRIRKQRRDTSGIDPPLKDARVSSIIEFGRIVHAEMNTLIDALSKGQPAKGATLYCTTFPCHMCARHIVGAGIMKVVYIEPYPKSLARDLYRNEICVEDDGNRPGAVRFEAFMGVAPRRYMSLFAMPQRKLKDGDRIAWLPANAACRYPVINKAYLDNESAVGEHTKSRLTAAGLDV